MSLSEDNKMEARESNRFVYIGNYEIKDILFRNFSGRPDKFHQNGQQPNFWLVLTEDTAKGLMERGLNVRTFTNRDGDEEYRLQVYANYGNYPPTIYKICGKNKVLLDEESIGDLDRDEIIGVDLKISPYHWSFNGNEGVKAYISKATFEILEDRIDAKLNEIDRQEKFPDDIEEDLPWN